MVVVVGCVGCGGCGCGRRLNGCHCGCCRGSYLVILGDAASAERQRYLSSQCVQNFSTRGIAVKRGLIVPAGSRVFESAK